MGLFSATSAAHQDNSLLAALVMGAARRDAEFRVSWERGWAVMGNAALYIIFILGAMGWRGAARRHWIRGVVLRMCRLSSWLELVTVAIGSKLEGRGEDLCYNRSYN